MGTHGGALGGAPELGRRVETRSSPSPQNLEPSLPGVEVELPLWSRRGGSPLLGRSLADAVEKELDPAAVRAAIDVEALAVDEEL